jgi:hypothetical protein
LLRRFAEHSAAGIREHQGPFARGAAPFQPHPRRAAPAGSPLHRRRAQRALSAIWRRAASNRRCQRSLVLAMHCRDDSPTAASSSSSSRRTVMAPAK